LIGISCLFCNIEIGKEMEMDIKGIKKIANAVRKWGEDRARNGKIPLSFTTIEGLDGMCGICSYELFKRLKEAGYNAFLCGNLSHAFVICSDDADTVPIRSGLIFDVTATQFDVKDKVAVVPVEEVDVKEKYFWEQLDVICDEADAPKFFARWPKEQVHESIAIKRFWS